VSLQRDTVRLSPRCGCLHRETARLTCGSLAARCAKPQSTKNTGLKGMKEPLLPEPCALELPTDEASSAPAADESRQPPFNPSHIGDDGNMDTQSPQRARRKWLRAMVCLLLGVLLFVVGTFPPFPSPAPRDAVIHIMLTDDGRVLFNATAIAAAATSYFHEIVMESANCRVMQKEKNVVNKRKEAMADATKALGTRWTEIGSSRPTSGTEIESETLAAALEHQLTFTMDEFEQLGLSEDLSPNNFVKARNFKYYRPLERTEVMYIAVSGPLDLVTLVDKGSLSVDGSLKISDFGAASQIAMSRENMNLTVTCLISLNLKLYGGLFSFLHIQGIHQEFGSDDLHQAAVKTVEQTSFDSIKETVIDLPNSVSVERKLLNDAPTLSRGNTRSNVTDRHNKKTLDDVSEQDGQRRDDNSGVYYRDSGHPDDVLLQRHDEGHMGISFQPLLPYIHDASGGVKSLYIHVETGISFNMTASFIGLHTKRSDIGIDHKNALVEVASFPFSWLLVTGNDTKPTVEDDRSRGRFFVTCAGGCDTHTLRSLTSTAMKAWTTHPMREIELSAAASSSSSHFFKTLVGDDHGVLSLNVDALRLNVTYLVPDQGRRVLDDDQDICMQMDLLTFRGEGCFMIRDNPSGDDLIPMSLPAGRLRMGERKYFETGEGEVLLFVSANLTQLERSTPERARIVVGFDSGFPVDSEGQLMTTNASKVQNAIVASGNFNLDALGLKLDTTLKLDFGIIEEALVRKTSPVEMDDHNAAFYLATMQLLNNDDSKVLMEFTNFALSQTQPVEMITWNVASRMHIREEELFSLQGALKTQRDENTTRGMVAEGSLSAQGEKVLRGRLSGHLIEEDDAFQSDVAGCAGIGTMETINVTVHANMSWTDGLQFDAVVVDADKHEVLFNVSAATNGVVSDEESMRGQAIMQLHVKMSDQDNLAMQCVLSGNLPTGTNMQEGKAINSTNVWIWTDLVEAMMKSHNNVTHGQKKEHLHGKAMLELKVSERALILADVGGVMILVEPSIGILGTALVVIGDYPIVDMQASAGATWPEVVGGQEGKYQGGVSLMQAEQELIGMNASIEGRQLNTELTGQGGLEVRVVGDAFIAGSGQMAVDWSDGISVEASLGGLGPPRACEMDYSVDGSIPSLEKLPSPTNALFEMCYANSSRHYEYSINPAGTQEGPRCRDGWWEAWPDGACKCVFCPEDTWYRDGKCFSKCVDGRSRFVTIPGTPVTVSMYGLIATAAVGRGGLTSTATGSLASERSQCPYAEATNCHDCNCPAGKFCVYVQDGECACHSCHQGWEYRGGKCIQPCPQGRRLSKTSAALSSATGEITEEVWVCSSCPAGFKLVCTNEWASSCDCFEASAVDWDVTMCTNSSNGQHLTDTEVVDPTSSDPSVTECPEIAGTTDWSKCGCKLETHGQTTWIGEKYMCAKCPFLSSFFVSGLRPTCHRCPQGHDYRINNYGGYYKGICFKQCKAGSWLTTRNVASVLTCDGGMVVGKNRWGSYGCYDCPTGRVEFDWWSMTMQCYPQDKVRLECGAT
jgi:hypothetical protein